MMIITGNWGLFHEVPEEKLRNTTTGSVTTINDVEFLHVINKAFWRFEAPEGQTPEKWVEIPVKKHGVGIRRGDLEVYSEDFGLEHFKIEIRG